MSSKIFISYRRADSAARALYIRQELEKEFGSSNVFFDIDTIKPGQDFTVILRRALAETGIFIAVIGPRWLEELASKRSDPDWVREEISTALGSVGVIIPVLVDGATMPRAQDLPEDIRSLAARHAFSIRHDSISRDIAGLKRDLRRFMSTRARVFNWFRHNAAACVAATIVLSIFIFIWWQYQASPDRGQQAILQKQLERREQLAWEATRAMDTEGAYDAFLYQFPSSPNSARARERLAELRSSKSPDSKKPRETLDVDTSRPAPTRALASTMGIERHDLNGSAHEAVLAILKFRDWRHLISTEIAVDFGAHLASADQRQWKDLGLRRPVFWAELAARGDEKGKRAFVRALLTGEVDFGALRPGDSCRDCEVPLLVFDMSKHAERDARFIAAEQLSVVLDFMETMSRAIPAVLTLQFRIGIAPINPLNPKILRSYYNGDLLQPYLTQDDSYGRKDRASTLPVEAKGYAVYFGEEVGINSYKPKNWRFSELSNAISGYRIFRCYLRLGLDKQLKLAQLSAPMAALEKLSKIDSESRGEGIIVSLDVRVLRLAVFDLRDNLCVLLGNVESVGLGDRSGEKVWTASGDHLPGMQ